MKAKKQNYFRYFNRLASGKLYYYIILNFFVGLLDGVGLALFIPLIYVVTDSEGDESLGKLQIILDAFTQFNIPVNIFSLLVFMVMIFFIKGFLSYTRSIYFVKIQQSSARKIRFDLINGLKDLSYEGYTKLDAGIVQNNMTTETARLIQAVTLYMSSIQHICMLSMYVLLAFFTNWQFAILVAVGGAATNYIYKFMNQVTVRNANKLSGLGRNFQAYLIQSLQNFKYLKATNYYESYNEKLKKEIVDSEETQFKIGRVAALSDNLREPLIILVISAVIIFQIQMLDGDVGSIIAALLLFYRSLTHLASFQSFWNKFLANVAGMYSVVDMLETFNTMKDKDGTASLEAFGNIEIHNLNFNYGNKKVLEDIKLTIKKNTSIALVGESGAGKTTLANLICGLLIPEEGKIHIDGHDISKINISTYRKRVGYVTQEPVIFDDTLFNNITFWAERNPENLDKFWKAVEISSLNGFIQNYEEKENISLGNNGVLISGGQKQRISIARELYKNIDLMILDEATSALDSETEKFIKDQIDALHGKLTMVVIAHRLSTIKNVDVIYLMEQGKIVDQGSYDELYKSSETFKRMVELQNLTYVR